MKNKLDCTIIVKKVDGRSQRKVVDKHRVINYERRTAGEQTKSPADVRRHYGF